MPAFAEARRRGVRVHTGHTDGKSSPSDEDSRVQVGWTEWQLNPRMFQVLAQEWGPFGLDAFAAEWNNQLPRYYSKHFHDVNGLGRDAMVQQLSQEQAVIYAFPPPIRRLVERFIQLVSRHGIAGSSSGDATGTVGDRGTSVAEERQYPVYFPKIGAPYCCRRRHMDDTRRARTLYRSW